MLTMKRILFSILAVCFPLLLIAEPSPIVSIQAEVSPAECTPIYQRKLHIKQTFHYDTLPATNEVVFDMKPSSLLAQGLWQHNLRFLTKIYTESFIGADRQTINNLLSDFMFSISIDQHKSKYKIRKNDTGIHLIVPLPRNKKAADITIEYDYYSDHFMPWRSLSQQQRRAFSPFLDYWEVWYFSANNMQWGKVIVDFPDDSAYFFANHPYTIQGNKYTISVNTDIANGLCLYIVEKTLYNHTDVQVENAQIGLYLQKLFDISDDCEINNVRDRDYRQYMPRLQQWISLLEQFTADSMPRQFDIIDGSMAMFEGMGYGTAVRNDRQYIVFADSGFWNMPGMVHEITHCYLDYACDTTAGRFLFSESFAELVAAYVFCNKDTNAMSDILTSHYNILSEEERNKSIFDVCSNTFSCNSWVIYYKAPYILFRFAQRIGFERFMDLLRGYVVRLEKQHLSANIQDFEQYLKFHGVSNEDWRWLYNAL